MTGRVRLLGWPLAVLVAYAIPYGLNSYSIHVANVAVIFSIMAIGEGLALGVAGQVNLAQVACFGLSAYMVAILTVREGFGFWASAALALGTSLAAGAAVGIPALRVQSHYLGIVTLGLALGFTSWVTNTSFTGAANGISGIPEPPLFGVDLSNEYWFFYFAAGVGLFVFAVAKFLVNGPHGRRMRAMRDDALAAASLGVNISVLRMAAFMIASLYAGIAGVLYAALIEFVSPESFSVSTMFLLLAMVIIGGRQSLVGCVIGTVALVVVREILSDHATYAQLGYGVVVVLVVVFAPTGLAGIPDQLFRLVDRVRSKRTHQQRVLGVFEPRDAGTERVGSAVGISGISMAFRGLKALSDIKLDVPRNQIRGLVGPNGSGKTTLFNVISGLYRPTAGSVSIDGVRSNRRRPNELSLDGMARTFQNLRLFPTLTVRENVLVAADRSPSTSIWKVFGWPIGELRRDRELKRRCDALLSQYGLTDYANSHPNNLPYGIQRRVEICRAMACAPALLLLDEPAAGLNGEEVNQLREMVRAIRDTGVTVLIVEHNMALMMSLCDQVTVLSGGLVIADGTPQEVVTNPAVITAYLGGVDAETERDIEETVETSG
jgi:branched-chain amino acid transport system permease protein